MLTFRDRLRTHDADRARYEAAKRDLAGRTWRYVQDYADAKTAVVESILRDRGAGPVAASGGLEGRPRGPCGQIGGRRGLPPDMERPRGTTRLRECRSCDRHRQRSLRPLRARRNHRSAPRGGSRLPLHEIVRLLGVCPPPVHKLVQRAGRSRVGLEPVKGWSCARRPPAWSIGHWSGLAAWDLHPAATATEERVLDRRSFRAMHRMTGEGVQIGVLTGLLRRCCRQAQEARRSASGPPR